MGYQRRPTGACAVQRIPKERGSVRSLLARAFHSHKGSPTSSTLNFPVGDDRANGVTVALSIAGTLGVTFVAPAPGPIAHVIFDVTGYFTP
jgi:hypothetical protein